MYNVTTFTPLPPFEVLEWLSAWGIRALAASAMTVISSFAAYILSVIVAAALIYGLWDYIVAFARIYLMRGR